MTRFTNIYTYSCATFPTRRWLAHVPEFVLPTDAWLTRQRQLRNNVPQRLELLAFLLQEKS